MLQHDGDLLDPASVYPLRQASGALRLDPVQSVHTVRSAKSARKPPVSKDDEQPKQRMPKIKLSAGLQKYLQKCLFTPGD